MGVVGWLEGGGGGAGREGASDCHGVTCPIDLLQKVLVPVIDNICRAVNGGLDIPYRLLMKRRYYLFLGRHFLPHFSWPSLPGYFTIFWEFVASAKLEFPGPSHCKTFAIS